MHLLVLFFLFAATGDAAPTPNPEVDALRQKARQSDARGDFTAGESFYLQAEALTRAQLGNDHFIALEDLGNHYWQRADYPSAAHWFRAALVELNEIPRSAVAPAAPAIAMDNLASILRLMGALREAQPVQAGAASTYASLGMIVDTAHGYAALGEIAMGLGDSTLAQAELKTAMELLASVRFSSLREEHVLVWIAQTDLALGNTGEATAALNQADAVLNRLPPPDPIDAAALADTKGALMFRQKRYAEAQRLWEQVLRSADAHSTLGHAVRIHLAELYNDLGQYRDAEPLLREVLLRSRVEPLARGVAESEMGRSLLNDKQPEAAEQLFHSAISDLEGTEAHKMPALAVAYARFADLRVQQKHWDDAVSCLRRAIAINRSFNPRDPATAHWLLDSANLYRKLGNARAAADCRAEARALLAGTSDGRRDTVDVRELEAHRN